jgi:DNA-binding FadR family transcriptional regulator
MPREPDETMQRTPNVSRRADLQRKSLHHILAQDIGARILKGEFAPGSLLPREAEWGRSYGVSRTAVREAIKMLMAKGLIVSRPKIGSRVQPRSSWNLLDRDVLAWYSAATDYHHFLASVQQIRRILEPEAAALAAVNHKPEELAAIGRALEDMRQAGSLEDWNAADVRFHIAILKAAGNELLVPLGFVIESALGNMFDYTATHNEDRRSALPLHEDILRAIRHGKPGAARIAARRLLNDTDRIIGLQDRSRSDGLARSRSTPDKSKGGRRHAG